MHELATRALCSRAWLLQVCARGGLNAAGRGFSVWKLRATKRRVCGSCEKMEHARTLCSGSVDGGGGGAGGGHSCWSRNLRTGSGLCAMHVESAAHSLVRRKHGDSQHGPCTVWKELQLWLKQAPTWHPSWRARTSGPTANGAHNQNPSTAETRPHQSTVLAPTLPCHRDCTTPEPTAIVPESQHARIRLVSTTHRKCTANRNLRTAQPTRPFALPSHLATLPQTLPALHHTERIGSKRCDWSQEETTRKKKRKREARTKKRMQGMM